MALRGQLQVGKPYPITGNGAIQVVKGVPCTLLGWMFISGVVPVMLVYDDVGDASNLICPSLSLLSTWPMVQFPCDIDVGLYCNLSSGSKVVFFCI